MLQQYNIDYLRHKEINHLYIFTSQDKVENWDLLMMKEMIRTILLRTSKETYICLVALTTQG